MISARFFQKNGRLTGVTVSGHAGFADYGQDIVCASVTSAVQLTANAITDVLCVPCDVQVQENSISISAGRDAGEETVHFLQALRLHLSVLAEDYPNTISISVSEV